MDKDPKEDSESETGTPFVSLARLLMDRRLSAATLAAGIEKEGIYTHDQFDRLVFAGAADKQKALDALVRQHEWASESPTYKRGVQSPVDEWGDEWHVPYARSGWPADVLPDFEHVAGKDDDAPGNGGPTPVSAAEIRSHFHVIKDDDKNDKWWKDKMRNADRNGLVECRVGAGKKGRVGSLWRPDLIASWVADPQAKRKDKLSSEAARAALKRFSGCEELANDLFPPDE